MIHRYKIILILVIISVGFSGCASPINDSTSNTSDDIATQSLPEETTTSDKVKNKEPAQIGDNKTSEVGKSTPAETFTATKTPTSTNPPNWSREKKYSYFSDNYTDIIVNTEVLETSIHPDNESMEILYCIDEENGTRRGNQTREITIAYAVLVDLFLDDDTSFDRKWVPKHVNVTAVNSSNEIYYTGHLKFEWAYKWQVVNEWKNSEYIFTFYETLDHGPAHPDYEEDPYDK